MTCEFFIGVDVGSTSARGGLFNTLGQLLHVAVKEIEIYNPESGYYEQSSDDIWNSVCYVIKEVIKNVDSNAISGIAFCATCSLVAINESNGPVSVDKNPSLDKWNVIMWMDHRADKEAEFINEIGHCVLKYVGGKISLEMETPKILWLKKNVEQSFKKTKHYFDLSDYLRWRATGSTKRSICTTVCKWTFVNDPISNICSWDKSYFEKIGLSDALPKLSTQSTPMSFPMDSDIIDPNIAKELGLNIKTKVGFSMIDAHSGVLGMIGCRNANDNQLDISKRLGLISGTSTCHMALDRKENFVPGVWGPYYGVIFKDLYLNKGGISSSGQLIDYITTSHKSYPSLLVECNGNHGKVLEKLEEMTYNLAKSRNINVCHLTKDFHVYPDFHGNRSPLADPTLKGAIFGLTLEDNLAVLYLATIQALAYASRHIKEEMEKSGYAFEELIMCGGLVKLKLYCQSHSDALGLPVLVCHQKEPVLLGAAMSAAAAATNDKKNLYEIVKIMSSGYERFSPALNDKEYHDKKYKVFLRMCQDQKDYRKIME